MNSSSEASQPAAPAQSQLFTLRVWAEVGEGGQPAWRFKVQHVLSGEARYFTNLQALVDFLTTHSLLS